MPEPIEPQLREFVAVPITGTAKASPTTVIDALRGPSGSGTLRGLLVTNVEPITTDEDVQFWIGVRKWGDTGATWEESISETLNSGQTWTFEGQIILEDRDQLVSYASVTSRIHITPEYEERGS